MSSISHALAAAEAVRYKLTCESQRPEYRAVTDAEIANGQAQKQKVKSILGSSIVIVNETLAALRKAAPKSDPADAYAVPTFTSPMRLDKTKLRTARVDAAGTPVENVIQAMSAEGLKSSTQSLEDMAKAIGPIVDNFDSILTKPYLDNFNATLNTVPVVGLKNGQIMYIETKQKTIPTGSGIEEVWSLFSSLPDDAKINQGDKVYMFPYMGDFCLAIGKAVWKKAHINEKDPSITSAVDNFPNLYSKQWVKLGDNVLPMNNLAGVVPFAVLSADRNQIAFHLTVLASDGNIMYLTDDSLGPGANFEAMKYSPAKGSPETPPSATGRILEQSGCTYSAADPLKIETVTEFTATDAGLVGLRADGYLYKRIVEAPPADSQEDATLKWTRWIKADGTTNLGVASPGVILDLNLLTRTLRSRYIDVQTSVYPVVDKIRAFGLTHSFYLTNVKKDAEDWQNASTEEQQELAIKNAKAFVGHAKTWSTIVSRSVSGAKESVNIMTKQLHDVRTQLETQLTTLGVQLTGLQATLREQEGALSKLKAAFWGSVAATLLGVALAVVGVASGQAWLLVGAGALFIGGLVAMVALSVQISKLAGDISQTKSQIEVVNTAIDELTTIVTSFRNLDDLYGTLNQFWGRMQNDASAIKTMDDATAMAIGEEILYDTSSIEAATDMTDRMTTACQTYLDVLNKQGIQIPTETSESTIMLFSPSHPIRGSSPADPGNLTVATRFHQAIELGCEMLKKGDLLSYTRVMQYATLLDMNSQSAASTAAVAAGMWFDVPALRSSGSIWSSGTHAFSHFSAISENLAHVIQTIADLVTGRANELDGKLDEVRPFVRGMLEDVISLGDVIQGWTASYPKPPANDQERAEIEKLQTKAITVCEGAQRKAAQAHNTFGEFTTQAREYQQDLQRQINGQDDEIKRKKAEANAQIDSLSPPWYVYLGGAIAVIAWMESQKASILSSLNNAVNKLNGSINALENLKSSGITFDGHAQTWIEMTETVSKNLGSVYNILSGIWGQLLEDPQLYAELMNMEWAELVGNARDVLQILNGGSSGRAFLMMSQSSSASEKDTLMNALMPRQPLSSGVRKQAGSAQKVFDNLDQLLQMPFGRDIIGYWDEGKTERKTLFDVTTSLRTEYVQMAASEYETIQSLYSLSILQQYRAQSVATGKLQLPIFVQGTLQSIRAALKAASNTSTRFGDSSKQFDSVMRVIESNISEIETKISGLDDDIEKAEAQLRDKIIWVVADVVALAFSTGVLLATFGVIGPVTAAASFAAKLGASAAVTASSVKLVLDSLSISDIAKTIASLKTLRDSLTKSVEELKLVRPLFKVVVTGVNDLTTTITDMKDTLEDILDRMDIMGQIAFTEADAEAIAEAWKTVRDDTQEWMDVINTQGISPLTFSIMDASAVTQGTVA
ncbi:hypothetical protein EW146_g6965 [Bondarzewia mesenterica]|uniref:Uncharacterized protein n=1 Tax=Bondarzewia mesenterica TaxID=1095465 RepID=A0A4S4LMU4_9AGAM|nr:hypothetical protein EW146_g6965 [Bondarzewia mesenterica]